MNIIDHILKIAVGVGTKKHDRERKIEYWLRIIFEKKYVVKLK